MKPRRYFLSRRFARKHAIRFGCVCTLATTIVVNGGDLLRGGAPANSLPPGAVGTTNTPAPISSSAAGSPNDSLAKTTQAIQAVQAMQTAARNLAKGGANNLGKNPNNPSQTLPDVPDGLETGGLEVDPRVGTDSTLWQGANLPVQSTNTGGTTQVTVKQTAQQALLNWKTFNVGKNTKLTFDQSAGGTDAGQWIAFNKVNDPSANPTQILGSIEAPGQVYIINRNGIIFGGSSQVNTHALVASSLPINATLVQNGLLNNPDHQFLFDGLDKGAADDIDANTKFGDIIVQSGATITSPSSSAHVGGRVMLVGPNVTNEGTISTPDGQTILAAGLQVGIVAHDSADPSLRGIDVYVGAVVDPASVLSPYAGTATNKGLIEVPRGDVTMTGKAVAQLGAIASTTSVSLNGRIDLNASYDAVANVAYNASDATFGPAYLNVSTGTVTLGQDSVSRILPELDSNEKVVGTKLALTSQVNITGREIHLDDNATVLAPSADVVFNAGTWLTVPSVNASLPVYVFMRSGGRIDLDAGAIIDVSGSKNVQSSVTSNIVEVQLRGAELANSPLIRDGALRGETILVDITKTGVYNGKTWIGTPLADVSGYANLVQRTVGELTAAGGTVKLNAGDAVVVRQGASIDVSGGSVNYVGGMVETSRLVANGKLFDISAATPDRVYDGVYRGDSVTHSKWGVTETYTSPLYANGAHYEAGYTQGGNGGSLAISAGSMALDGKLKGTTVVGERQRLISPAPSILSLSFTAQRNIGNVPSEYSPTAPSVTFASSSGQTPVADYAVDGSGNALPLPADRISDVVLSPDILGPEGFGSLSLRNPGGNITVNEDVSLNAALKGSISLEGVNIQVDGDMTAVGGTLSFKTHNISPDDIVLLRLSSTSVTPPPAADRGQFILGANAKLSTAGKIVDDRLVSSGATDPQVVIAGGTVSIDSYLANLAAGSVIDVSGGVQVDGIGKVAYGNAGSISILSGRDSVLKSVTGGSLTLGSELRGFSGATGGKLSIQAGAIQIGGTAAPSGVVQLQSSFFDQGGFSSFELSGIGLAQPGSSTPVPGVLVASGTTVHPVVSSWLVSGIGSSGPVTLGQYVKPEGLRSPTNITFDSLGVVDDFNAGPQVSGQTVIGHGAVVDAGPLGSVTVKGGAVEVHGSLLAAGGSIRVIGADVYEAKGVTSSAAFTTVVIGSDAVLDASGTTFLVPDPYGRTRGAVLDGGTIQVSGNIVAESGAVLDVSGASGQLDLLPGESGQSFSSLTDYTSGTTSKPYKISGKRTTVESDGGAITLDGGEMLWTDATLRGAAGGTKASAGTLSVSSGRYYGTVIPKPIDTTLVVTASSPVINSGYVVGIGAQMPTDATGIPGGGRFSVNRFAEGGFANLDLGGTVRFQGDVAIHATGRITAGTGPTLSANGAVSLNASYVVLGTTFRAPFQKDESQELFLEGSTHYRMPPVYGDATLSVSADLIDVGYLSLQGIGRADLVADGGDIRGNGTFEIAGDLGLKAAQIYPPTAVDFTIAAFDYQKNGSLQQGSVTIEGSGVRKLPLSAGGTLSVYASNIHQNGVLRAPFGTIRLGWDGTGTSPVDILGGQGFASTKTLVLGSSSVTSVSAIDPVTGKGITIPYGTSTDGSNWIDPHGTDISASGPPQKSVTLSGASVVTEAGSDVDIRGGGDLMAYRWVNGLGGTLDILASMGSFAVVPGYDATYAPYAPFNGSATSLNGDSGYVNGSLQVGDQIRLEAGSGLPAGVYTLLPARYAVMEGAYLVTPKADSAVGSVPKPDGSYLVSGFRFNGLEAGREVSAIATRFEVASSQTVVKRAEYTKLLANTFLSAAGSIRLPGDSGQLVLAATQAMAIGGDVLSAAAKGFHGGLIDISSPVDIVISGSGAPSTPGTLTLDASLLSEFSAESLLIGGYRQTTSEGTKVNITTSNLTLDNEGSVLSGSDIILVAKNHLELAEGSQIQQTATTSASDTLLLGDAATAGSGNGAIVRVGNGSVSSIVRRGVTPGTGVTLTAGANAILRGQGIALDSSDKILLDQSLVLDGKSLSLGGGHVTLQLDPSLTPGANAGLVLSGATLASLSSASSLSLASYSSLDLLGAGNIGGAGSGIDSLTLRAAEIRGLQNGGGTVNFTAKTITLDNFSGGTSTPATLTNAGDLSFHAQSLLLGAGTMTVNGFSNTILGAAQALRFTANGAFSSSGNVTAQSPLMYAADAISHGITAKGSLVLGGTAGTGSVSTAGLGASLAFTGSSVTLDSRVVLPSGFVTLHATGGDVVVNGSVDAGGVARRFKDVTRYTDGGHIRLVSDHGNVTLSEGGSLNVAARPAAGDGGQLDVVAAEGAVNLFGSAVGSGGTGGDSGIFTMDVGHLATTAALDAFLNDASFDESRGIRVRHGDVVVDGITHSHSYTLSADQGSIRVTGTIDASGATGGAIRLVASDNLTLAGGSILDASAAGFDSAGKGGSVTLETRGKNNGILAIQNGSLVDLGVDAWTASSASAGKFNGTLHLRAPRNAANTDLAVASIDGEIRNASNILVEGYQIVDLTDSAGIITSTVQSDILASGQAFLGTAGTTTSGYTAMMNRLLANNSGLASKVVLAPGAELVNTAAPASLDFTLGTVGSTLVVPTSGGVIVFPTGTPGNTLIRSTIAGTITSASGVVTTLAANTSTAIPVGATITLATGGTLSYASGTGGNIAMTLKPGGTYTTSATGGVGTVSARGSSVTLNTAGSSGIAMSVGTVVTLPTGTVGTNRVRATVGGTITAPNGTVTSFAANTNIAVTAGSKISLAGGGTLTFATGTGGAIPVALASGSFTTVGATGVTPANGNLTLGSATSTSSEDWNLATARFGPKGAAGVLTLRAQGNIALFNTISDGFTTSLYNSGLVARNIQLADNIQTWSYRLVSGADFSASDTREVKDLLQLDSTSGSLLLGKNAFSASISGGAAALTSTAAASYFQVIRTGSGDIDVVAGRDIRLLNPLASIYSAGTLVADPTMGGTFDIPKPSLTAGSVGGLGSVQQPTPAPVQYTMAGGNVSLDAGNDIIHLTLDTQNRLIADSQRQMPVNWLYRRGYVDASGNFGTSRNGEAASTTWWVDFTNFFEGIGALGGGNVSLTAGRDVSNVDAVAPTNARMAKGTPDASKLVELGGGDVSVKSGRNIDGGVYYVERGHGALEAGGSIITNSTRSPSLTTLRTPTSVLDSSFWLPTTLFVGKADFDISASGDILLGPAANTFLLPQGYNNTFWYKTWFSTYGENSGVEVSSLGGSVTLREGTAPTAGTASSVVPILQTWFANELLLTTTNGNQSAAFYQPWLRLTESTVAPFSTAFSLMPGNLSISAYSGNVNLVGNITLAPSKTGDLEIFAAGAINGLQIVGAPTVSGQVVKAWAPSTINLSDTDPNAIPGITKPFAYQTLVGLDSTANRTQSNFLVAVDELFAETGSTDGNLQKKQSRHTAGNLHAGDSNPVRLYAEGGDISGLTLYSGKATRVLAGNDISDISLYLQNLSAADLSIVAAGRDLVAYNQNTPLRIASRAAGNFYIQNNSAPAGGDIQIAGPGTLEVLAGRNLDLGTGAGKSDGTGTGITSIGNGRNPYLPIGGADLIVGAGIGASDSLSGSAMNFQAFITKFVLTDEGTAHLKEFGLTPEGFSALGVEEQRQAALQVFYLVLRDSGRDHNKPESPNFGNYDNGQLAIDTLFPGTTWKGDILTRSRDIRTKSGGDISLFAPGGSLTLATTVIGSPLAPPGIITEAGGNISVFTDKNVDLGISRIFTLRGGDEIIWSTRGDIAAGSSSKTVQSAPPTRVLIDPQSADVKTDLAGLATGGGIGVLTSVAGVEPSDVDLIAPVGTVDAGDAGIRVSGNINIAAAVVVNAANISVGGTSTGANTGGVSGPGLGSLTAASNTAGANASMASEAAAKGQESQAAPAQELPSIITVEVIGYGGGEDDEDDKKQASR